MCAYFTYTRVSGLKFDINFAEHVDFPFKATLPSDISHLNII